MRPERDDERGQGGAPWTRYASLGYEIAGGLVGFILLGYGVDYLFGTAKVGLITGAIIGAIAAMVHIIRRAIELSRL
ncbi:MAG: AtpZ/AtpI family protein [Phycisphaerales bacterium]|nr:AtpZ/AtpI family protein [Phycisphaerales bacterium]